MEASKKFDGVSMILSDIWVLGVTSTKSTAGDCKIHLCWAQCPDLSKSRLSNKQPKLKENTLLRKVMASKVNV